MLYDALLFGHSIRTITIRIMCPDYETSIINIHLVKWSWIVQFVFNTFFLFVQFTINRNLIKNSFIADVMYLPIYAQTWAIMHAQILQYFFSRSWSSIHLCHISWHPRPTIESRRKNSNMHSFHFKKLWKIFRRLGVCDLCGVWVITIKSTTSSPIATTFISTLPVGVTYPFWYNLCIN